MSAAHIEVKGVSKVFGASVVALQDINLEIPRGQFVCLLGHRAAASRPC